MTDVYTGLPPKRCMKMKRGDIPLIAILESDCSGGTPDHVMMGDRIFTRAQPDHKRYWREMVGTYLRHEMPLDWLFDSDTKFRIKKFPDGYELYGGMRENGDWDYYLFGFKKGERDRKFDSPANFVLHAKWLMYGRPTGACGCKWCSGTNQIEISKKLSLGDAKMKIKQPRDDINYSHPYKKRKSLEDAEPSRKRSRLTSYNDASIDEIIEVDDHSDSSDGMSEPTAV